MISQNAYHLMTYVEKIYTLNQNQYSCDTTIGLLHHQDKVKVGSYLMNAAERKQEK